MASSSKIPVLMNLMDHDRSDHVDDSDIIEFPTHVFPHNIPDYFLVDVDPATIVNTEEDLHSGEIPHLSPIPSLVDGNSDFHSVDNPHLSPTHALIDANSDQSPYTFSTYLSPNGTNMWSPIVSSEFKPVVCSIFLTFEQVYAMYRKYGEKADNIV
ncbi:hypothetical protein L1987_80756 [Smallanthus sonchifolius]|uniref:Uncharacterized protein n=1 Tax=Smallanthus sonchifolius TaxID=185202 RepID=A0ACB8YNK0_9ASTR|nr:hypothetical protein L1987_80756 [Smallanthus sonchifolius]